MIKRKRRENARQKWKTLSQKDQREERGRERIDAHIQSAAWQTKRPHLKFGFCPTSAPSGGSGFGTIRAVDIVFWSLFGFLLEKWTLLIFRVSCKKNTRFTKARQKEDTAKRKRCFLRLRLRRSRRSSRRCCCCCSCCSRLRTSSKKRAVDRARFRDNAPFS